MSGNFSRFDRLATLYVAQPLRSVTARSEEQCLPVLMYHSISETREDGVAPYFRTVTHPETFREQMKTLQAEGWRGVTLREGLEWLTQQSAEKLVAITFDDGFEDFYTSANPALQETGFSATMYLPTAYIGETQQQFKGRPCMTWKQVRELHAQGIEFGSHTVSHPILWDLDRLQIAEELRDSKRAIEDQLGTVVRSFAYPYAFPQKDRSFTAGLREELQSAGYDNCATTTVGRVAHDDDRFALKRLPVNSCDDPDLLRAKLQGAYDWLAIAQNAVKTVKTAVCR